MDKAGEFKWGSGTLINTAFWLRGEPNNENNEHCVQLRRNLLNDCICSEETYFVCEK